TNKWLEAMVAANVIGGHNPDGTAKNGCLQYDKHAIVGIYDLASGKYLPVAAIEKEIEHKIGKLPKGHYSWKALQNDRAKAEKIAEYFKQLSTETTFGALLAKKFLEQLYDIAKQIVSSGAANQLEDVDKILKNGFFHLYGPSQIPTFLSGDKA